VSDPAGVRPRLPRGDDGRLAGWLRLVIGGVVLVGIVFYRINLYGGEPIRVEIPSGATSPVIAEILESHDVIGSARLFHVYVRMRGVDRGLKAGVYEMETRSSMRSALRQLSRGEVETVAVTVPEGLAIWQLAPRILPVTGGTEADLVQALRDPALAERFDLPGPTVEGYLFPDTYRFARGVPIETIVDAMVERYREVWTPDRRARLAASGMSERDVITLASIIQTEARQESEMPRISGVYHNRIENDWLLQADPTVIYALGGYRERLLYAAIDSVADSPYNTYTQTGLPPGPIASPGELAIDAALEPEEHDLWYFVARPDGFHAFTRTLAEHNAAKEEQRQARQGA
jgi:peptidoglycan lytic transglycosylase G